MHDLKLKRYRPRRVHALNDDDFDRRMEFCETLLYMIDEDETLVDRLVFGDEAKLHMNGTVNRYNQVVKECSTVSLVLTMNRCFGLKRTRT
jgi:hypothetical protein